MHHKFSRPFWHHHRSGVGNYKFEESPAEEPSLYLSFLHFPPHRFTISNISFTIYTHRLNTAPSLSIPSPRIRPNYVPTPPKKYPSKKSIAPPSLQSCSLSKPKASPGCPEYCPVESARKVSISGGKLAKSS